MRLLRRDVGQDGFPFSCRQKTSRFRVFFPEGASASEFDCCYDSGLALGRVTYTLVK